MPTQARNDLPTEATDHTELSKVALTARSTYSTLFQASPGSRWSHALACLPPPWALGAVFPVAWAVPAHRVATKQTMRKRWGRECRTQSHEATKEVRGSPDRAVIIFLRTGPYPSSETFVALWLRVKQSGSAGSAPQNSPLQASNSTGRLETIYAHD